MSDEEQRLLAFDTASSDFDRLGVHLWNPIGAATVAATAPQAGERVLDACCGTGASALPAAARVGATGHIDAVDLSAPMIGQLRRAAADLPQLTPRAADVTSWPEDGYDVVQAVLGIFFFPDMTAGTEHLITRARPGGRVGLTIWRRGSMEEAGRHLHTALARVTGNPPRSRPKHPLDGINESGAYRDWLTDRGLTEVTVTEHELRLTMTAETAWLVVTGSGYVGALSGLDSAQTAEVREGYLETLAAAGITELEATTLIGVGTRPAR
ncbi:methyltransferase domain-containing protein [Nocardia sp. NPDC024068]|uniref:class I SAM-dependent methyltransferase n=1 Tax=Nocardia sp. NPDC024068 TaxID=3157197 RepID=UPI0033F56CE3